MASALGAVVQAGVAAGDQERGLRRAALALGAVVAQLGLVAEDRDAERARQREIDRRLDGQLLALAVLAPADAPRVDRHPVLGQRPRLVRTDHRDGAQTLHRGQPPHERPASQHALRAEGERRRGHRRQPFRHGGHRQGDRAAGHLEQWHSAQQAEPQGRRAGAERDADQSPPAAIQLALERRRR